MRGVISAAGYVPYRRLDRSEIAAFFGSGGGTGTRAVASYDEDTTTMGQAAADLACGPPLSRRPSGSPRRLPPTWRRPTRPPSMPLCGSIRPCQPSTSGARSDPASARCGPRWLGAVGRWWSPPTPVMACPPAPTRPPPVTAPPRCWWATAPMGRCWPSTSAERPARSRSPSAGGSPAGRARVRGRSASALTSWVRPRPRHGRPPWTQAVWTARPASTASRSPASTAGR